MLDISMLSKYHSVRRMCDADADELLRFCSENKLYYQYCGAEPSREQIVNDLHITPPGVEASDKYYLGFFRDGTLEAVLDLIEGYPDEEYAFIGFFMVNAALQGRQIGSRLIGEICAYLKKAGMKKVRLGIAEDNPQANHFWRKNGFAVIERVPMEGWTVLAAEKTL